MKRRGGRGRGEKNREIGRQDERRRIKTQGKLIPPTPNPQHRFVMMTPQLFINYKLQSVAHLNWRTMTYKSLNTFVDDLFAFVIKMPIMHRLACFRDDVVFFVFLYQRWIYRVDFSRVNEYGQCAEPTDDMIKEKEKEVGGKGGGEDVRETVTEGKAKKIRRGKHDRKTDFNDLD